jgi:hypothetical protein
MIVALTSASLDITLGVAWWTLKQVLTGAIYLGTYMFSESSVSKKNKILGDDPNFVPHAFSIDELEIIHSHTTLSKSNVEQVDYGDDFVQINKTESILTTKDKYFKIPLTEIIRRKEKLPLWFIPFLNTYPLTNYAIINNNDDSYLTKILDTDIFSPFTLSKHLEIKNQMNELHVYIKQDDVEIVLSQMLRLTIV